jgi:hypothetical protein
MMNKIFCNKIHYPNFMLNNSSASSLLFKEQFSDIGFCLRLLMQHNQVSQIVKSSVCLRPPATTLVGITEPARTASFTHWIHLYRFHLKTETEFTLRYFIFLKKYTTPNNTQNYDRYIYVPSLPT